MKLNRLEAVLYYDKIFVKGIADISLENKSCEFKSDFVPIIPFDSQVTIVTKHKSAPFLRVTGSVFLSSKKLLRVQPFKLALYEGAETSFEIPVKVQVKKLKNHLFSQPSYENCTITGCAADYFTLSGKLSPDKGDNTLELIIGQPIFTVDSLVKLEFAEDGFLFGKNKNAARYKYRITDIDEESKSELLHYIRSVSVRRIAERMERGT